MAIYGNNGHTASHYSRSYACKLFGSFGGQPGLTAATTLVAALEIAKNWATRTLIITLLSSMVYGLAQLVITFGLIMCDIGVN